MDIDPGTISTAGGGVFGLGGFFIWLRSLGCRITKQERKMEKITDPKQSPFVQGESCKLTTKRLDDNISGLRDDVKDSHKALKKEIEGSHKILKDEIQKIQGSINQMRCMEGGRDAGIHK